MRPSAHRSDIQGLRAVAVLLVVLNHAGVPGARRLRRGGRLLRALGLPDHGPAAAEARANGSVSLVDFYVRRARRILPAAALTLLVDRSGRVLPAQLPARAETPCRTASTRPASPRTSGSPRGDRLLLAVAAAVAAAPLLVARGRGAVLSRLAGAPLAGALRRRADAAPPSGREAAAPAPAARRGLLAAASLGWSVHLTQRCPRRRTSPRSRAPGSSGSEPRSPSAPASHACRARQARRWLDGAAGDRGRGRRLLRPNALPRLRGAAADDRRRARDRRRDRERQPRAAAGRVLAVRPLGFVGDRSYAYYLWHWPVLILAAEYVGHDSRSGVKLGLLAGAFLLSCVSYALVENPIRRTARSRTATGLVVAVSAAAVLGTAGLSLAAVDREQQRFESRGGLGAVRRPGDEPRSATASGPVRAPDPSRGRRRRPGRAARRAHPLRPHAADRTLRDIPLAYAPPRRLRPSGRELESTSKICRIGRTTSRKLIVLIGDSHAQMWLPAVLQMARRDGWAVVPLLRPGCTPGTWSPTSACRRAGRGSAGRRDRPGSCIRASRYRRQRRERGPRADASARSTACSPWRGAVKPGRDRSS